MTASQPPQPPQGGGQPPQPGQPPVPGQPQGPPSGFQQGPPPGFQQGPPGFQQGPPPGYQQGPPPGYQQGPPPGYQQGSPPGYQQGPPPGYGQPNPYGQPAGSGAGFAFDLKKLKMADYVIAGGTVLYLVFALFPWYDFSNGYFSGGTVSGFGASGNVTTAFVLFLLATAWAILPAFADVKVPFPRSWVTVGLTALATLLTLFAWIRTFDWAFSIWALLGFLTAVAILLFAVLALLPELKNRPALPGGLANAAQWANQPAPQYGAPQGHPGQQYGAPQGQQPGPQYGAPQGQPGQQPPPPPTAPQSAPPHAPPPPPAAHDNGPGTPDRPADS